MRSVAPEWARSDEQRVANPLRHQLDPPIDQRFHQDLAHLGVGLNEGVHLVACQLDDFAGLADAKTHQRRATEDHADVTSELFGVNGRNQDVAQARGPDDLYLAGLDDEERHVGLAAFDQDIAAAWFAESLRARQSARSARDSTSET